MYEREWLLLEQDWNLLKSRNELEDGHIYILPCVIVSRYPVRYKHLLLEIPPRPIGAGDDSWISPWSFELLDSISLPSCATTSTANTSILPWFLSLTPIGHVAIVKINGKLVTEWKGHQYYLIWCWPRATFSEAQSLESFQDLPYGRRSNPKQCERLSNLVVTNEKIG